MLIEDDAEQTSEPSMEQTIAQTLRDIQGREDAPGPDDEAAPVDAAAEPVAEKPTRARGPKGRFAKADETPAPVDEPEPESKPEPVDPTRQPAAPAEEHYTAPSSWKPSARAKLEQADPEIRAEVARRENDVRQWAQQVLPDAELGKALRSTAQPYEAMLQSEGASIDGAFGEFLQINSVLRYGSPEQKAQALYKVAEKFGIPLDGAPQQQQPDAHSHDPRVDMLIQREQLRQREHETAQTARVQTVVEKWSKETKDGKPVRPHLNTVMEEFMDKLPAIKARNPHWSHEQILQESYDRAVRENPTTYALLLKEEQDKAEAKRREENLRKVTEAKKAAAVNVPKRGSLPTQAPVGSMDETIRSKYRELTG